MDAVKFLMESNRICQSTKFCGVCPMSDCCLDDVEDIKDAIKTVAAVEKWSKEHPLKTNGMVLMEKLERMGVSFRRTMMNELEQKVEIEIDAEWWDAEYKEGEQDG